jgi:hypothetical protein
MLVILYEENTHYLLLKKEKKKKIYLRSACFCFIPQSHSLTLKDLTAMAMTTLLYLQNPLLVRKPTKPITSSTPNSQTHGILQTQVQKRTNCGAIQNPKAMVALLGAGLALTLVGPASSAELPYLQLAEPANALSLPTWAVHVSSVVEW